MNYIGIDLGTSSVKMLLMDETGKILKIISREYPIYFPNPGWSEQNPEDWFEQTILGLEELLSEQDKSKIAGVGISGQMHGLVVLDEKDQVIRPAILWNDGRTEGEVRYLNQEIGQDKLLRYTGNIAFAGFTAPKVLWMKNNEPDNFKRIKKLMLPKDYVNYMLTGVFATEYSDAAGTLLLDVKNKCWSKEMLDICGIDASVCPKLFNSYESIGCIKRDIADKLGLAENVIVVAGAADNAGAALGTGALLDGSCNISLGTSGTIFVPCKDFEKDCGKKLHSFVHVDGGYHLLGCILSAASCNKWFMDDILRDSDYKEIQNEISDDKLGNNHILFLPYLMGERSPINDTSARAAFIGMSMDSTREDMLLAVLEGVGFALRDCVEVAKKQGINIKESTICGGGAKSPLWRRIISNILNIPLNIVETEEGPSYGAAMLATVACGEYRSLEECKRACVRVVDRVEPDAEIADRYEKKYQIYSQLYPALKGIFNGK